MGDGNFKWWCGYGRYPETCSGPFDSRKAAIAEVPPEGGYTIIEADKAVLNFDIFDATGILDQMQDHNEECWGEDGMEINATPAQERELETELAAVFKAWLERHDLTPKVWSFGETRKEEYIEPTPEPPSPKGPSDER